jgi:hypothetical protein
MRQTTRTDFVISRRETRWNHAVPEGTGEVQRLCGLGDGKPHCSLIGLRCR